MGSAPIRRAADGIAGPAAKEAKPAAGAFDQAAASAKQKDMLLDLGQMGLDVAGIVDPTPVSDGINGAISLGRGDVFGAVVSGVSMIPYIGDAAKLGKLGKYAKTLANAVELAKGDARFAKLAEPVMEKLRGALNAVPTDKLPSAIREPVLAMKKHVDDFFAPKAPPGAPKPDAPKTGGPDGPGAKPPASPEAARFGRTDAEFESLAKDPAHGGKISPASTQERRVGLELEQRGAVKGPLTRDPTGAAEFVDAAGGKWDVKGFNSNFPVRKGGFSLERDAGKVDKSLQAGENVMLDTSKMTPQHVTNLKAEGAKRGWGDKVVFWP